MELDILKGKKVAELREIARALKIPGADKLKKKELIDIMTQMHLQAEAERAAAASAAAENAEPAAEEAEEPPENAAPVREEKPETPQEQPAEAAAAEPETKQNDNRYDTAGILDIAEGGFGFLRFDNFLTSDKDIYVSPTQIRRFNLKTGDEIFGVVRKPNEGERFGALLYVKTVNGDEPGVARRRRDFSELTPIYPEERICLEKGMGKLGSV